MDVLYGSVTDAQPWRASCLVIAAWLHEGDAQVASLHGLTATCF